MWRDVSTMQIIASHCTVAVRRQLMLEIGHARSCPHDILEWLRDI